MKKFSDFVSFLPMDKQKDFIKMQKSIRNYVFIFAGAVAVIASINIFLLLVSSC